MYDPVLGRTFQQDPLAEKYYGNSPYGWVANNPLLYADPTGMQNIIYLYATKDENGKQVASNKEMRQIKRGVNKALQEMGLDTRSKILKGDAPSAIQFDKSDHLVAVGNSTSNASLSGQNGFDKLPSGEMAVNALMRDSDNNLVDGVKGNLSLIDIERLRVDYQTNNNSEVKDVVSFGDYIGGVAVHESGHSATLPHSGINSYYGAFKVDESVGVYGHGDSRQFSFMGTPSMLDWSSGKTYDVMSTTIHPAQRNIWNAKFNGKPRNNAKKRR